MIALPSHTGTEANLDILFAPKTIAIVGVSQKTDAQGNKFIRRLRLGGYKGDIYPIHPNVSELEGFRTYPSLAATPRPVDYAFIAIPAKAVPGVLESAENNVRFAQIMSSGFGEGGQGINLRNALLATAKKNGIRLLGPNCLGTYSPKIGMSFIDDPVSEPGSVGIFSQSGGLSADILRHGESRGLGFSGVVSLGNSLDVGPCELLSHYLQDEHTHTIGAYLEDIHDGRRFFQILQQARARKPVVLLKGGRTEQGLKAAASHTGSMAGREQVWQALAAQTGSVLADSLEDFINILVAFDGICKPGPDFDGRTVLFGNGGGASVLAADSLAQAGIELTVLSREGMTALEDLRLPAGAALTNPLDVPANILDRSHGAVAAHILETIVKHEPGCALLVHINIPVAMGYRDGMLLDELMDAIINFHAVHGLHVRLFLVLRSTGQIPYETKRRAFLKQAQKAGIPVFLDLASSARALQALKFHYFFRLSRS